MFNKKQSLILFSTVILLLIPLIAMQFTSEVKWDVFDFIVAAILLITTGFISEFIYRKLASSKYRYILILSIIIFFILIWAELAVGVFGTPFSGS